MRIVFLAYNNESKSIKNLQEKLNERNIKNFKLKTQGSQYKYRNGDRVINWGCSNLPEVLEGVPIINCTRAVGYASNKLSFFSRLDVADDPPRLPRWTTDPNGVKAWLADGDSVCARTVLTGHSAEGLILFNAMSHNDIPKAPLYTKYVKKKDEYRIHIFDGDIIDVQRKAIREGFENPNHQIRNLNNGYVYVRGNVKAPDDVIVQAMKAINASGLEFGAVDVIWNALEQQAYVLEINTAPGLSGTTVDNYVQEMIK